MLKTITQFQSLPIHWFIPGAFIILLLAGCAAGPDRPGPAPLLERGFHLMDPPEMLPVQDAPTVEPAPGAVDDSRPQPLIFRGNDRTYIQSLGPGRHPPVQDRGDQITLNFEQAPLQEVVHAILGDLLGLDYTVDQPLTGEVTLRTHAPIPRDSLIDVLSAMLQANGAVLVKDAQDIHRITPADRPARTGRLHRRGELPGGHATVIAPLRHIGAVEMADILAPLAPDDSILRVDTLRNLLVLQGGRDQLEAWFSVIDSFDVDYLAGMSVGLFPLEYAAVAEVRDAIRALLGEMGTGSAGEGAPPTSIRGVVRVLPIERLNSLLVITPRAHYLDRVAQWVDRLDRPMDNDLEPRLYVYPVQNGTATHLARLLSELFGAGDPGANGVQPGTSDSGLAPGLTPTRISDGGNGQGFMDLSDLPEAGAGGAALAGRSLGKSVRVVADEHNNALLVLAPRKDYRKIESALRQLDRAPTQVLIEASIVEITLRDGLEFGLEWHLRQSSSGFSGNALLNPRLTGGISPQQPGFSYAIANPAGQLRAVFNALASDSLLRVLSNPSILVLDNHTASIHVGDQQPVRSARTQTDGGLTTESIEYKDTGIMLSVTPSVNAGGLVTMNITQTVTDVGSPDEATGQRTFLQRQVRSRIAVRSGESIVLGGLIRDNQVNRNSGVPGLRNAPLVGGLFGSTERGSERTELLVMITPRALQNDAELRAVSEEMRTRMQGLRLP
ncbi:general secretion pathway protein D [Ectothiorhodospira magna]|uniref:General secretion pathway protein D n=1 Tax=Ectothiorhodospira magna TaxID=867345 RepID=A0A1H9BIV9_9GAMM|nr:type II secretion system secretin GspD [Ectothiorhodospira magna]SEP88940.1 general secretion pathway protein D [Ectothiorhodospira magna]